MLSTLLACCSDQVETFYSRLPPDFWSNSYLLADIESNELSSAPIDILWVVDNSGSMAAHQSNLQKYFSSFMAAFTQNPGLDYSFGLLSTDTRNAPYLGFDPQDSLTQNALDPVGSFQRAVARLGTKGAGTEKAFTPIMNAIRNHPDFLRPKARLGLIIVSDAAEQSTEISVQGFVNYLIGKKGNLNSVSVYGILGPSDFQCAQTDTAWTYKGSRYEAFMKATKGHTIPLCSDFSTGLLTISQGLVSQTLSVRIHLPRVPPDPSTIAVSINTVTAPEGSWRYDSQSNDIVFLDTSLFLHPDDRIDVSMSLVPPSSSQAKSSVSSLER
ncbi:MAG: VWA domain-containing protein [Deltaproteobacteria bacterium]|nr:VWA domain-containing protein [Deltaproteobacteria bacterium]